MRQENNLRIGRSLLRLKAKQKDITCFMQELKKELDRVEQSSGECIAEQKKNKPRKRNLVLQSLIINYANKRQNLLSSISCMSEYSDDLCCSIENISKSMDISKKYRKKK